MCSRRSFLVLWALSGGVFLPGTLQAADEWATLKGRFVYDGTPPAAKFFDTAGKDAAVCGKQKIPDESLVVDAASKGIANVAVFARKTSRTHESAKEATKQEIPFDQKDCIFLSHVLGVQVGQTLLLKNSDPIGHNTNITTQADTSINPLLPPAGEVKHVFRRPQLVPIPVTCNIHPWMKAYILPRGDSYFAVSGKDGSFEIANLPAGEDIEFQVWHERAAGPQGSLLAKKEWAKGRFKLKLTPGETKDLGTIAVGARAFR